MIKSIEGRDRININTFVTAMRFERKRLDDALELVQHCMQQSEFALLPRAVRNLRLSSIAMTNDSTDTEAFIDALPTEEVPKP